MPVTNQHLAAEFLHFAAIPRVIACLLCGQETAVRTERVTVNGLPYNVYYCAPCNVTMEVKESE